MTAFADLLSSFVGNLGIGVAEDGALVRIEFLGTKGRDALGATTLPMGEEWRWERAPCGVVREQLEEYFAGERREFELKLAPMGSAFQLRVWEELRRIPYGRTASYGELAERVGKEGGARAVGQANHVNPIPIVIPCHRVIGADGGLTGFGGGIDVKRELLDFERGQRGFEF